jgi:hypothetical protein
MLAQAQAVAARPAVAREPDAPGKVRALYRLILQRAPDADELHIGTAFLAAADRSPDRSRLTPIEQFAQVLLLTNEVMFVD